VLQGRERRVDMEDFSTMTVVWIVVVGIIFVAVAITKT